MLKHLAIIIILAAILSCGQNEPLSNYEPKSPQERALKNILMDFQESVNARDSKKLESLIHEDAAIMVGSERKILSKAAYSKVLPKRLAENPPVALGTPKMSVTGDDAEVRIYMTRGDYNGLVVFNMKMENGKWYILNWKY